MTRPADIPSSVESPEELLRRLAGPEASFREHQREAILDLVDDHARVLCVQRTGWGKSAVYFVATAMLRARGRGPTLIVSPLLALMRNQIAAAERLGLRAVTINSTNRESWGLVQERLERDDVDLLLISPERLNHPGFRAEMLPLFAQTVGLVVVDEAHCISDWGHDFRPDYRRIKDLLGRLPGDAAVLCTTATANDRVVSDVEEQLAAGAADPAGLHTYRGTLTRKSLRLEVVELPGRAERLAWLAEQLPKIEGSGIVYTLTKADAEAVASWLTERGIVAAAYSGETDPAEREAIEARLSANEIKAVVATAALGMGYDKPDLGFVIHYQAPGSVIAYYQQVGRAGRGLDHAEVVLLRGAEDRKIQDFFIAQAFPPRDRVDAVLEALGDAGEAGMGSRELLGHVRLGPARLAGLLKVLDVEGAVTQERSRWRLTGQPWEYDTERYAQVTALRRTEQAAMAALGRDGRCLMRALQEELDDPEPADCGRCSVCAQPRWATEPDHALVRAADLHLRRRPIELEVRKMAPSPDGAMRKIPVEVQAAPGRALGRLGDGVWDKLVDEGARAGRFPDVLVDAIVDLIEQWQPGVQAIVPVPSSRTGQLVPDFAARVGARLGLPVAEVLARTEDRPPQREMENTPAQVANVRGAFAVRGELPPGPILLLDDVRLSGWTLAMVAGQLRQAGAPAVYPLVLASSYA